MFGELLDGLIRDLSPLCSFLELCQQLLLGLSLPDPGSLTIRKQV